MDSVLNPLIKEKQSGIKIPIKKLSVNALFVFTSGESFLLSPGPQNSPIVHLQHNTDPVSHNRLRNHDDVGNKIVKKLKKQQVYIVSNTAEQQI